MNKPPAYNPPTIGQVELDLDHPQGYVPTGLAALDDILVGLPSGDLTLVAAKPSQGKTALALQVLKFAAENGLPSLIFSMEMSAMSLKQRMLSSMSGVPTLTLRRGDLSPKQRKAANAAIKEINSLPLYVDDRSGLSAESIYSSIVSAGKAGIGLIAVDYVQLMTGRNESRQVQVGDAVKAVKAGAKAANVPLLVLSQQNRGSDSREDKFPRMSDLRDSGELEQVADNIIMFHYPEDDLMENVRLCDFVVVKQRNGPTGIASFQFNKPATRFEPVDNK